MTKFFYKFTLLQFLVLFGSWLVLSGRFDFFHVTLGFISALAVTLAHVRLNRFLFYEKEVARGHQLRYHRLALYLPWLIGQIVLASLQVARVVLSPRIPVHPKLIRFRTRLPNITARTILGSSITLTPGTLTIDIDGDEFLVHSLMDESSAGIVTGALPGQVAKLYHRRPSVVVGNVQVLESIKELRRHA